MLCPPPCDQDDMLKSQSNKKKKSHGKAKNKKKCYNEGY